ncbi:helix-turn-helix transcriptional regulator [Streptomyces sp. NPDC002928]|uniref:helix-turn-helix domain-containing protein n=1 Tax=Streptomyces sp. NPDC002928 TaxID=3154440 RepID=UPI00339F855F
MRRRASLADFAEPPSTPRPDAELRVASLAARSQSNREIAEELFITLSTVEQHMTRVSRKIGVRSRGDLSAELLEIQAEEEALTR